MAAVCGIDWAAAFHDVRIADEHGRVLVEQRCDHDEDGISALLALLAFHHVQLVAIERSDGLLVGRLTAAVRPARPVPTTTTSWWLIGQPLVLPVR